MSRLIKAIIISYHFDKILISWAPVINVFAEEFRKG